MRRTLLIGLACAACTPWASPDESRGDAQVSRDAQVSPDAEAPRDARVLPDAEREDAGSRPCADPTGDATEVVTGTIRASQTWSCDNIYLIVGEVQVFAPVTITIEPGTVIKAADEAALVFRQGARLVANGRADAPVVFTSNEASSSPGEWRGIALMGRAGPEGDVEHGLTVDQPYGGTDDDHDCGTLRYVRIEWAGDNVVEDDGDHSLGALVLAGCGTGTVVDHVQVRQSEWEGVVVQGGSVRLRHLVLTNVGDEALDWRNGWNGSAQFVLARLQTTGSGSELTGIGLQADGPGDGPIIANATLVGMIGTRQARDAFYAEDEAEAVVTHSIFIGWGNAVLDVEGATVASTTGEPPPLRIDRSIMWTSRLDPLEDAADPAFDERAHLSAAARMNLLDVDPLLEWSTGSGFGMRPGVGSPVDDVGCGDTDPRLDSGACYAGGIAPGAVDWSVGWTIVD